MARNFEYFGEDPFLAGAVAAGYITGMQRAGAQLYRQAFPRQQLRVPPAR